MDDNKNVSTDAIAKLDTVIANLREAASKEATTVRQRMKLADALRDVIAIRAAIKKSLET